MSYWLSSAINSLSHSTDGRRRLTQCCLKYASPQRGQFHTSPPLKASNSGQLALRVIAELLALQRHQIRESQYSVLMCARYTEEQCCSIRRPLPRRAEAERGCGNLRPISSSTKLAHSRSMKVRIRSHLGSVQLFGCILAVCVLGVSLSTGRLRRTKQRLQ